MTLRHTDLGVAALLPLSLLPFAAVHEGWRAALGVAAALVGGMALVRGLSRRNPNKTWLGVAAAFTLALLIAAGSFVPLSAEARQGLNPTVQGALAGSYAAAGVETAPLALELHRGLQEWGLSAALVVCLLALGLLVRDGRRAGRLAWTLLGCGLGVLLLAILHRATGATGIWGTSVPEFSRDPFFGVFVNPNHGGLFCAALVPLALGLGFRKSGTHRAAGVVIAALMLLGALFAQSRGALLALAAGLLVGGALLDRRAGVLGGLAVLGTGCALVVLGPTEALIALSEFAVPEALDEGQDLVTGRGEVLADAALLVGEMPLLGVGPSGFDDAFQLVKRSPAFSSTAHAHMELMQLVVEQGVIATGLWVIGFVVVLISGVRAGPSLKHRRRLLLAGFGGTAAALACSTLYTFPLRIGALQVLGVVCVGAVLGLSDASERSVSRRAWWAAAPSLTAAVVLVVGWFSPSSQEAQERAVAGLDVGDGEVAVLALEDALRRRPANRHALQLRTRAEVMTGDIDGAFEAARLATEIYPSLPWVWRDLARLQRRVGDFSESRDTWARMLACDIPEEERLANLREALQGPGDPLVIADQVLPDRADILVLGGRELERAGHPDAAEPRLARAAELEPRYGAWHGAFLLRQGRMDEALAAVKGLDSCFAREVTGNAHIKGGDPEKAREVFLEALASCGGEDELRRLRIGLARARLDLGDDGVEETLLDLLDQRPEDTQVLRLLAREARDSSRRSKLTDYLRRLVDMGVATDRERQELERLEQGLPIER